ncbi:MAG: haloacid dehalogenase-like hydrolase [Labilithrix sp.]
MQTATVDEILRDIDSASRTQGGGAIAFDGDGTLWSGDIGEDFFEAAMKHGLHPSTREPLAREAMEGGLVVTPTATAHDLAHAIHAAYLGGAFSEERICEVIAWIAGGWTHDELRAFCKETVAAIGLRDRLHGEAIRVLRHAQSVGIAAYLVSASPLGIVEAAAAVVGIPLEHVTAVRERVSADGVVECGVVRPITYGEGKVTNLRALLGEGRPLYAAFGDNAFDVPLLRSAQNPVAIRPKQRLLDRAHEVPGLRILERI